QRVLSRSSAGRRGGCGPGRRALQRDREPGPRAGAEVEAERGGGEEVRPDPAGGPRGHRPGSQSGGRAGVRHLVAPPGGERGGGRGARRFTPGGPARARLGRAGTRSCVGDRGTVPSGLATPDRDRWLLRRAPEENPLRKCWRSGGRAGTSPRVASAAPTANR